MNLTELTVADVDMLIARLQYLSEAGEQLRELGAEPVFRVVPGESVVITAGWALPPATEFGPPPPFVVEPYAEFVARYADLVAPPVAEPDEIAPAAYPAKGAEKPGASGDVQQLDHVECPPADAAQREKAVLEGAACEPRAGAMPADSIPGGSAGPSLGPMGEAEKAAIRDMAAKGMTLDQIVAATNRRVQSVASVLRAKPKETTGQPVAAASTSSPVVAVDAQPETPAAGAEVPPADTGMPAREREAGVTAPEAGGAAPDFTFDQRRINAWLDGLGYRRGWSAQRDCDLLEALGRGLKFAEACADMGFDPRDAKVRWDELVHPICPDGRTIRLERQADLLVVLRHRAAGA